MRMVEKVARAQYYATPRNKPFKQLSAAKRIAAMKEARAAIEAMREPTEEMIDAAERVGGHSLYRYQAMIDKAIQESGE